MRKVYRNFMLENLKNTKVKNITNNMHNVIHLCNDIAQLRHVDTFGLINAINMINRTINVKLNILTDIQPYFNSPFVSKFIYIVISSIENVSYSKFIPADRL